MITGWLALAVQDVAILGEVWPIGFVPRSHAWPGTPSPHLVIAVDQHERVHAVEACAHEGEGGALHYWRASRNVVCAV